MGLSGMLHTKKSFVRAHTRISGLVEVAQSLKFFLGFLGCRSNGLLYLCATRPFLACALLLRLGFEVHGNFVSGEIGNPAMAPQPGDGDWRRRPGKADDPD
jgi:hypothetical protein